MEYNFTHISNIQIQEANNNKFFGDYTHTHYKVPNSELLKLNLKLNLNVQLSAKRLDFVNWTGAKPLQAYTNHLDFNFGNQPTQELSNEI